MTSVAEYPVEIASAAPGTVHAWQVLDHVPVPTGPWQAEPTKVQWVDAQTGLPCLAVRNRHGSWCGYAAVWPGHPWHGLGYDDAESAGTGIDVHGGLTYADRCQHGPDEAVGICHVPEPGTPDDVWWFGFDCAHAWDLCPTFLEYGIRQPAEDVYRDLPYVARECASLAAQLAAVEVPA